MFDIYVEFFKSVWWTTHKAVVLGPTQSVSFCNYEWKWKNCNNNSK